MLLRITLGGALLAFTAACSGDMDASSDELEGELEEQGSELVDDADYEDVPEPSGVIEKATFNDSATINGFNVACTTPQKNLILAADARAREILGIAGPANASARVNRTTSKATTFKIYFVPNGNSNPDPNRTSPDAWDIASSRVGQKSAKISQVLASNAILHTCHGGNETVGVFDGAFKTCNQLVGVFAVTNSVAADGLPANTVRWCDAGLALAVGARGVTLLHELSHQDRTNDATGGHVFDDNRNGPLYNAHNYGSWFSNNQP